MIKIAHRGNTNGPKPELENSPEYLKQALDQGFQIETDVWVQDGKLFLGHDKPQYEVTEDFLTSIGVAGWFHCKNLEALRYFRMNLTTLNFFWHQADDYTITSRGFIWTYPGGSLTEVSVAVDLTPNPDFTKSYATCADYLM